MKFKFKPISGGFERFPSYELETGVPVHCDRSGWSQGVILTMSVRVGTDKSWENLRFWSEAFEPEDEEAAAFLAEDLLLAGAK